ncbi:NADP-specific glutamate dehydrogenase [Pallidibacillus pasinlerensis]|uniref:Glutamate dehydrogenase n=1 Tax=Pallidibacillus pasinlerensis TaxID=2703818 RepID=A0ABX0A8G2_9BACI|nr:NADP-specific glutamate dehydrogenase [Pallidibacillus pasinlerensis]NCU17422.1 NADP-specific glutamate dehydrogenase [Pallidibacillus pasinlerensis]
MAIVSRNEQQLAAESYIMNVFDMVQKRNAHQPEFLQAVKELFNTIQPVFVQHPEYIKYGVLERITEPDRIISFRVSWVDDQNRVQVNRGYRVQFNDTIGPYKGGIRFHPTVNESIIKFLGFEQIFKNALTGLPIGGGKGGADFDPKGKSDREIMHFCQAYMTELSNYIGPDVDVPAGDIGVGAREIGYMFGQYKRLKSYQAGVLTGKGVGYGGSLGRTEATGYGVIYFVNEMLKEKGLSLEGSTVVVSGSGNVATYAMQKAMQLGAKVVACSDSNGYIYDPDGIKLETVKEIKEGVRGRIKEYVDKHPNAEYYEGCTGIWSIPCDIALPCATQNELDVESATLLIQNGVKAVAEGANMPCSLEAVDLFIENGILFGPGKAANAGGVAVSALEMSQNSMRLSWTFEEVDSKLQDIMKNIYRKATTCADKYGYSGNLVAGANISGFLTVAEAMMAHGVY